jgi:acylpyruvate hydrolase
LKLVTCEARGSEGTRFIGGLLDEDTIVDLAVAQSTMPSPGQRLPSDMLNFLALGDEGLLLARQALDHARRSRDELTREATSSDGTKAFWLRDEVRLLPAVPRPGKIIHTSVNFAAHKKEVATSFRSAEWQAQDWGSFHYKHPTGFLQAPSSTVGTDATVVIPRFTEQLDYELELAIIIGRRAKNVSKEDALKYVAGYCIFNDISARDIQAREHSNKVILLGKSFDTSCPLGPWITTRDEVPDPQNLAMQLYLNGELRQDSNTSDMVYGVADLVSWWSNITLEPGDVITSGSPSGVIAGRENPVWLAPGDRIEATIQGLGKLVNTVARGDDN